MSSPTLHQSSSQSFQQPSMTAASSPPPSSSSVKQEMILPSSTSNVTIATTATSSGGIMTKNGNPTTTVSMTPSSSSSSPPSTVISGGGTTNAMTTANTASSSTTITTTTTTTSMSSNAVMKEKVYLWEWDVHQIQAFARKTSLFPTPGTKGTSLNYNHTTEKDDAHIKHEYNEQYNVANILLNNLCNALQSASTDPNHNIKPDPLLATQQNQVPSKRDMYHILDTTFSKGKDVVHKPGAILSRLTLNGYINAFAGHIGGIADCNILTEPTLLESNNATTPSPFTETSPIPTASNLTFQTLLSKASNFSHTIQAQLEMDMLESTPSRIINLLCPELTLLQVSSIRHRVVETVIHGRGTNTSNFLQSLEEDAKDIPTMAKTTQAQQHTHEINKYKKCPVCSNNDQGSFVLDKKNGDVICTQCGTVISESLMHEGSMYRKFEGEEDRNHHGDVSNPLFSNAYNTATSLSGVSISVGAGIGGYGSQGRATNGNIETILKRVHNYTELNISQMGKEEKKTRIGYKDRQKKEAFVQMNHVGDALSLHTAVLQRAKELFSGFRDDRELLQQFKGVIAACLCEAFDQLSNEGKQILKLQTSNEGDGADAAERGENGNNNDGAGNGNHGSGGIVVPKKEKLSARASRRNELHSSNMAGKGGLKLNLPQKRKHSNSDNKGIDSSTGTNATSSKRSTPKTPTAAVEDKPVTAWNLDDARTWLLDASRIIARKWFEQQDEAGKPGSAVNGDIPKGTADEMEGNLVQYSLKLCNVLENEMKKSSIRSNNSSMGGIRGNVMNSNKRKVVTPRVNDLGSLSIKWQHKHERGSGGAGGIGHSGSGAANLVRSTYGTSGTTFRIGGKVGNLSSNTNTNSGNGKSAGQILRLKTASQLKKAIGDSVAGDAFYRELRALLGRQDAKAKLERSEEASIRRMNQMKRKPELQARVQL